MTISVTERSTPEAQPSSRPMWRHSVKSEGHLRNVPALWQRARLLFVCLSQSGPGFGPCQAQVADVASGAAGGVSCDEATVDIRGPC